MEEERKKKKSPPRFADIPPLIFLRVLRIFCKAAGVHAARGHASERPQRRALMVFSRPEELIADGCC